MADPIREALKRLLAVIKPKYTDPDEIVAVVRAMAAARTALAAEPLAPAEPVAALHVSDFRGYENYDFQHLVDLPPGHYKLFTACTAQPPAPAEPDTDAVLTLAAIIREVDGNNSLGAAALAEAILAHPNAASVFQPPAPAPAADGEREELAQWLEDEAVYYEGLSTEASTKATRAAALLREARPQPVPVPVTDHPWERPGWCDAEGRCWMGDPGDEGFIQSWWYCRPGAPSMAVSLPHWTIPIPPPPEPPSNDHTETSHRSPEGGGR